MEVRELQLELVEILKKLDQFCKENGIAYSLGWGTLLGAIRHKGFIPWDDDIDIFMTRDNYTNFVASWNNAPVEGLFLQNADSDPEYHKSNAKLMKIDSTYIEYEYQKDLKHTGIFIDIFIFDRVHNGILLKGYDGLQWVLYFSCLRGKLYSLIQNSEKKGFFLFAKKIILQYRKWFENRLLVRTKKTYLPVNIMSNMKTLNIRFPANMFDSYCYLEFEGQLFPSIKNWDEYLHQQYGNYMQLPPVEQRTWTHSPMILDLRKSYAEIQ